MFKGNEYPENLDILFSQVGVTAEIEYIPEKNTGFTGIFEHDENENENATKGFIRLSSF